MNKLLQNRFGTSPRLTLSNAEWLEHGMHAKTVKFDIGQGGEPPEVTWEDRSAALAKIDSVPAKALASLLVWGQDENWDWSIHFDEVVNHLAKVMIKQCRKDNRQAPKGSEYSLEELARLMARMVLHFELYDMWGLYTVEGRLLFSGIKMNDRTYSNHFLCYQRLMLDEIDELVRVIDRTVGDYRNHLNQG